VRRHAANISRHEVLRIVTAAHGGVRPVGRRESAWRYAGIIEADMTVTDGPG
jgi:hypothetical protein